MTRLHSYVVASDTGFAPNPFWGRCTLANCKPTIRRKAAIGDWIVGLGRKALGHRLVYAMEVAEILDFASFWHDPRFANKIPDFTRRQVVFRAGDNIYEPLVGGDFRQLQSMHSNGDHEDPENKAHDLGGRRVIVATNFHYFGGDGPALPPRLHSLIVARGHKNKFPSETVSDFLGFLRSFPRGVVAPPTTWPADDESWREAMR